MGMRCANSTVKPCTLSTFFLWNHLPFLSSDKGVLKFHYGPKDLIEHLWATFCLKQCSPVSSVKTSISLSYASRAVRHWWIQNAGTLNPKPLSRIREFGKAP